VGIGVKYCLFQFSEFRFKDCERNDLEGVKPFLETEKHFVPNI
jgi:hypothetical protein